MSTQTDTPRTNDALGQTLIKCGFLKSDIHGPLTDLARQLERELAEAQAYITALEDVCKPWQLRDAQAITHNYGQQKQPPTSGPSATCGK